MNYWRVGIVGGGPGGLFSAYFLEKWANKPCRVTLFEASSRLGGKIQTSSFQVQPAKYEVGAAEFYDYSVVDEDPLRDLITELGLGIIPMMGSAVVVDDRVLANRDDFRAHYGDAAWRELLRFDHQAHNLITKEEFYNSDNPEGYSQKIDQQAFSSLIDQLRSPMTQKYIERMIHSDLAAEVQQTSLAYGLHNYLMNDATYMNLYCIDGGNELLPRTIAERLAAEICLNERVTDIITHPGKPIKLRSETSGKIHEREFDFLILALPHNYLLTINYHHPQLREALNRHHAHYDHPAHYLRVTILFREAFWRDKLKDSFWMLEHFGGCCLYDESSRSPGQPYALLGWLLGGEAAQAMSQLSDDQLIAQMLGSLPSFLPEAEAYFLEGKVHRWLGAVNALPGGKEHHTHDRRHQPEPRSHGSLFTVGDYLFDSTVNGVLDSAQYVARWIVSEMNLQEPATLQARPKKTLEPHRERIYVRR